MGDVRPIPLTDDDDDFFSDLGGDELYSRASAIGTGSRLVIDENNIGSNTSIEQQTVQESTRQNPFGNADDVEVRSRKNINHHKDGSNNNSSRNTVHFGGGGAVSDGYVVGADQQRETTGGHVQMQMAATNRHGSRRAQTNHSSTTGLQQFASNYNNHQLLTNLDGLEQENGGNNKHLSEPNLESTQTLGVSSHCHVPHEHESGFTVRNQLIVISVVTTLFGAGEVVGAILSKSIAIGTDVMHLGSDLLSFLISLTAVYLAKRHPTARLPWGLYRAEVLGALLSVFIIWVVTGVLVYLAAQRIYTNTYSDIEPDKMLFTSIAGVVFNVIMALVLNVDIFKCKVSHGHSHGGGGHGHSHSQSRTSLPLSRRKRGDREQLTSNTDEESVDETLQTSSSGQTREKNIVIRAAFVHVIGDLIQSVGVLIAALIIKFKGKDANSLYRLADPICTFTFSVLVLITTITVIGDAFFILMEGSPKKIKYDQVYHDLSNLDGVKSVHSLKIWSLTSNEVNASVHLAVDPSLPFPFDLVAKANKILREGDVVTRSTVQIEAYDEIASRGCTQCLHPGPSRASLVI